MVVFINILSHIRDDPVFTSKLEQEVFWRNREKELQELVKLKLNRCGRYYENNYTKPYQLVKLLIFGQFY